MTAGEERERLVIASDVEEVERYGAVEVSQAGQNDRHQVLKRARNRLLVATFFCLSVMIAEVVGKYQYQ